MKKPLVFVYKLSQGEETIIISDSNYLKNDILNNYGLNTILIITININDYDANYIKKMLKLYIFKCIYVILHGGKIDEYDIKKMSYIKNKYLLFSVMKKLVFCFLDDDSISFMKYIKDDDSLMLNDYIKFNPSMENFEFEEDIKYIITLETPEDFFLLDDTNLKDVEYEKLIIVIKENKNIDIVEMIKNNLKVSKIYIINELEMKKIEPSELSDYGDNFIRKGIKNYGNTCYFNSFYQFLQNFEIIDGQTFSSCNIFNTPPNLIKREMVMTEGIIGQELEMQDSSELFFLKEHNDDYLKNNVYFQKNVLTLYKYKDKYHNVYTLEDDNYRLLEKNEDDFLFTINLYEIEYITSDFIEKYIEINGEEKTLILKCSEPHVLIDNEYIKIENELEKEYLSCMSEEKIIESKKYFIVKLIIYNNRRDKLKLNYINFLDDISINNKKYELISFIVHIGRNLSSGHYINYSKINTKWYLFNDNEVKNVIMSNEYFDGRTSPYILLYKIK